ncbi:glycosyl transferases group 1 family protein [Lyngbya aestuarii BL J]|uniref:Glycosyl transferases group 1 family protein n=1 Tax=Lyngbya aestuarii BL J TaxID=1348334 RepID=U7QC01_9CYAN|nr:glycosyltransferase [Lyngbya aestuarii]ERT04732.1 glycosyl transferases group 1 family protein [Lyngbya aestuarii BL J]
MKIALVHDYLTQKGGAERVFELLCHAFPKADIFTSLYEPRETINLENRLVYTTALQSIPGASKNFRLLAPFYYRAFRSLNLQEYDLIISSSTSFAKAVRKRADAKHICFCHNVTRFLWDTETYLEKYQSYRAFYPFLEQVFRAMRKVDHKYAQEPDVYIANSTEVAKRIRQIYNKNAMVVNYPIDNNNFFFSSSKQDYFLVASRFLGYKRIDITIKAFNKLGLPLKIIGSGPEEESLRSIAKENIEFLGFVTDEQRKELMANARAVIVSALEDYGLVPVEANASGTPVIAYGAGGVLDTQIPEYTGLFFEEQTPESLYTALIKFQKIQWNYAGIRDHAVSKFSQAAFFSKLEPIFQQLCGQRIIMEEPQSKIA